MGESVLYRDAGFWCSLSAISAALAKLRAGADAETVSVFDVVVDRENRQYFDIVFDTLGTDGRL